MAVFLKEATALLAAVAEALIIVAPALLAAVTAALIIVALLRAVL